MVSGGAGWEEADPAVAGGLVGAGLRAWGPEQRVQGLSTLLCKC